MDDLNKILYDVAVQVQGSPVWPTDALGQLNYIAGTTDADVGDCMAALGATSKEWVGGMNELASTTGLEMLEAARQWLVAVTP